MKMNAVKEVRIANLICATIESEHGKIELVFEGWGIDSECTDAQFLDRYSIKFDGEHYQVNECEESKFCHGDFKSIARNLFENTWFLEYEWAEMAGQFCERAELLQLLGSAIAYINNQLFEQR